MIRHRAVSGPPRYREAAVGQFTDYFPEGKAGHIDQHVRLLDVSRIRSTRFVPPPKNFEFGCFGKEADRTSHAIGP